LNRSKKVRWHTITAFVGSVAVLFSGCDDSTGLNLNPVLVSDTVTVFAPLPGNAGLPSALDITSDGSFGISGGRFPERIRDALQWDLAVRVIGGNVVLIPARGIGVVDSRAALTPPITGETFEGLREAPGQSTFTADSAIVMSSGNVHVARSREVGFGCVQFAKLQPVTVDPTVGSVHFQIVTNERCGDPRLVAVD
jgi:hypothetical protein